MNSSVSNFNFQGNNPYSTALISTFLKGSTMIDPNKSDSSNSQTGLSIYNAFTGTKIVAPFNIFTNMESFKVYIAQALKIDVEKLFLLTPLGIKLKYSMIVHEQINELFVFDRKFFIPGLIKVDKSEMAVKELLLTLKNDEQIFMIKPRDSPLSVSNIDSFISKVEILLNNNNKKNNSEIIINSTDLDFDSLRLLLSLVKRNSGWSSALLSDMRSALYNNIYYHDYKIVENILRALNSLIQYFSNIFISLEREFNQVLDKFSNMNKNSLADKWEICFKLLEKITFSYTDKKTKKIKNILLSELIDLDKTLLSAQNSKRLSKEINQYLIKLKDILETDIMKQKEKIINEYESYKSLYLKLEWDISEKESMEKSNQIYKQLEKTVGEMSKQFDNLPSFEELITTSNNLSTHLSQDSISKLNLLIESYKSQSRNFVPKITNLANNLYNIQNKYSEVREELQRKIISNTLISIVRIQLLVRDANMILTQEIFSRINLMKNDELQLSFVADIPVLFGIWVITILSSIKHKTSLKKLLRKTNEVMEMLTFLEKKNKTKWLQDFIDGIGAEKVDVMFLNNLDYKNKFIIGNLLQTQLISINEKEKILEAPVVKRQSSEPNNYLAPFNKMFLNFNKNNKTNFETNIDADTSDDSNFDDLLNRCNISYFEELLTYITMNDVLQYLKNLENADYDPNLILELKNYMKNIGIEPSNITKANNNNNEHGIVFQSSNFEDLGSFDFNDAHYIKIFKTFIKSFESDGIIIDIKTKNSKIENSKIESSKIENLIDDSSLVNIYKERVQKLENLLHEKRFQNFNDKWSQLNNQILKLDNIDSIKFNEDQVFDSNTGVLGRKTIKMPPIHYSEKIQRLEDENKELKDIVNEYKRSQTGEEVEKLKKKIEMQKVQIKNYQTKIEDVNSTVNDKDKLINELRQQITQLLKEKSDVINENKKLNLNINELNTFNKDLLENMSNKENELLNENQLNQQEKNHLKLRIEELLEIKNQYDSVIEKMKETDENVCNALSILSFAFIKLKDLSNITFKNLETFCLILEMMGLLLIEDNNKMDIKRVKGLKYIKKERFLKLHGSEKIENLDVVNDEKKGEREKEEEEQEDDDTLFFEIVASNLPGDYKNTIDWVPDMEDKIKELKEISCFVNTFNNKDEDESEEGEGEDNDDDEDNKTSKIKEIEETLESINRYDLKLKSIIDIYSEQEIELKYQDFKKNTNIERNLILSRVHKRFEDVESLARKLQKEKVQLKLDIKNLNKKISQQLVLRNFQKNDLVLFLKTLVPILVSDDNNKLNKPNQPWAVFNIGYPNYYLKYKSFDDISKLEQKEWFVGRIKNIEEFIVTVENKDSPDGNPFNLSVGTKWFFVVTKEEVGGGSVL